MEQWSPTEPSFFLISSLGSQKVLGPDSVMPYPVLNSTPSSHHFSKIGGGHGAPPLATQRTLEKSKLSQRGCNCIAVKIVGTPKKIVMGYSSYQAEHLVYVHPFADDGRATDVHQRGGKHVQPTGVEHWHVAEGKVVFG